MVNIIRGIIQHVFNNSGSPTSNQILSKELKQQLPDFLYVFKLIGLDHIHHQDKELVLISLLRMKDIF